jgi:tetratricopeptide (TPR) repeat protein
LPTPSLWKSLTAYAYYLEHEGRLEESLEALTLAVRSHGSRLASADFVPYALLAGRLNRLLARWDPATVCYQAALEAASHNGDSNRALRARLGRAHVDRARQSDAQLDLGVVLMLQGSRAESLQATYNAFRLSQDAISRMRILGDLGYALNESGYYSASRVALEIVAESDSSYLIKLNAILELMQLESAVGTRVAFERRRQQARPLAGRMTPSMAVDYRYKTAVGLARFEQVERAFEVAREALALAEQHHLNEWYFRVERMLQSLESTPIREADLTAPAEADATPAVLEMTSGLREYASLTAV